MIGLSLLALLRYLDVPSATNESLLLLAVVLLAQSRYESALFVIPVGLAVLWVWWRRRAIHVSWTMVVAPLLLIPYAWQRVFMVEYPVFWQKDVIPSAVFSLVHLQDNLSHAVAYFFSSSALLPNSLLLSLMGCLSIVWMAWVFALRGGWRKVKRPMPSAWAALGFGLVICANFTLLMLYFWGQLNDPAVWRIAMPFIALQVGIVLWAGRLLPIRLHRFAQWSGLAMIGLFFVFVTRPALARSTFMPESHFQILNERMLRLADAVSADPLEPNPLVLSQVSLTARLKGLSTISTQRALEQLPELDLHMRLRTFGAIWLLYQVPPPGGLDEGTFDGFIPLAERVESAFELTLIDERRTPKGVRLRLARVDSIRPEALPAADRLYPTWGKTEIDYTGRMEGFEARNKAYVESLPR